ncbi:type I-E CRISPR-associated protein Cse1/CasA [Maridesulfovibrio sp.]|uniref:type I-E CRISPR-associated protein Cse1/CasA n=1 Tax=Maridesulfovibrio sp. TaxID=2795000 RepID=UPI002A18A968|nr:type I-E CRISPR-associated protein Cse1/CasA [Maridesulfovibrio sp.]
MRYNILKKKWLPIIRADGSHDRIAPFEITGGGSPPVDLIPPRPDFRAALMEFLIGLIQTVRPPDQEKDWLHGFTNPPAQDDLQSAMLAYESYFNLFGERPRFMQDLTMSEADKPARNNVSALLIDAPGGNTLKLNTDFFNKRGQVESLCPACAAMSLFTLQAFAPSGGKGHRTSLRGGGPLSTLVKAGEFDDLKAGGTLWDKIWLNVLPLSNKHAHGLPPDAEIPGNVFPWAAPTRTSEKSEQTTPEDVHPLHVYWSMPRRIVLEEKAGRCSCSLCGAESDISVPTYLTRPSGYNYSDTWNHPLTPYRVQTGSPSLSVKGQANISAYSHWLGLVYGQVDDGGKKSRMVPAACVLHAGSELYDAEISVAGFDMDNMKAVQWCEHEFPFHRTVDDDLFRVNIELMVMAADKIRSNLVGAVKDALINEAGKNQAKVDKTFFSNVGTSFWAGTSARFYELAAELARIDDDARIAELLDAWARHIHSMAGKLFQEWVMSTHIPPERYERYISAGRKLGAFNYSYLTKNGLIIKGDNK